jgi:ubiquinone/menaquinone biosynthesis C-methylase UbiE
MGEWDPEGSEVRALSAVMAPGGQALTLEIGCGEGRLLSRLCELRPRAIGVDPSLPLLAQGGGKRSIRGRLVAADATRLPFADGPFDEVIFGWSL